jgi:hypothetical protein
VATRATGTRRVCGVTRLTPSRSPWRRATLLHRVPLHRALHAVRADGGWWRTRVNSRRIGAVSRRYATRADCCQLEPIRTRRERPAVVLRPALHWRPHLGVGGLTALGPRPSQSITVARWSRRGGRSRYAYGLPTHLLERVLRLRVGVRLLACPVLLNRRVVRVFAGGERRVALGVEQPSVAG